MVFNWDISLSLDSSVTLYEFGQGFVVNAKGKRLEIHCPDVHGRNIANISVTFVFFYKQYGFRLIIQLRTDMPSRILIPFVLMQYRMDVYLPVVRPLHQFGYDTCGFSGAVDVIYHVTDAVND